MRSEAYIHMSQASNYLGASYRENIILLLHRHVYFTGFWPILTENGQYLTNDLDSLLRH